MGNLRDLFSVSCGESQLDLVSGSSQQSVGSTGAVLSGTVVHGEDDDDEKNLCLFRDRMSVDIFYALKVTDRLVGAMILNKGA